jgi:hypothetical protein
MIATAWEPRDVEALAELSILAQRLHHIVSKRNPDAPGLDGLVAANDCIAKAQQEVEARRLEALSMSESLRPFSETES